MDSAASEVLPWHSPVLEEQVSLSFTSSKNGNCSVLEFMHGMVMYATYLYNKLIPDHPLEFFAQPSTQLENYEEKMDFPYRK